jgi:hypothetical protein
VLFLEGETEEEREERIKEAKEEAELIGIKEKIRLLETHPPRIVKPLHEKGIRLTIQDAHEKPLAEFDKSTQIYQWVFLWVFNPSIGDPYVLTDLDALAKITKLSAN